MNNHLVDQMVYTPHGKGMVVAAFFDGTVCVRLESGGGAVFLAEEVLSRPHHGDETEHFLEKDAGHRHLVL